jgi:hypothetical protein
MVLKWSGRRRWEKQCQMTRIKELPSSTNSPRTRTALHHGKEDHQTGHEHSKQALEHANKAFELSQEAHRESVKSAGKS